MKKPVILLLGALFFYFHLLAQSRPITGKVTDEGGSAIANATILAKGSSSGTASKNDGTFSLNISEDVRTLVVSSVNYTTQEVAIGKTASFITVQLKGAQGSLSEVVVVGYGVQKKSDVTSSIAKVSGDKVANVPLTSVDQILQGKVAGLQSTTFSGQPGANQPVRIRGVGSYSASSQPLYVVDGIQINSGELTRIATTSNVLANINPDDIESISVLKDAAATAIYGSRGGNGVIVISTKRGKAGKTQFKATAELGVNKLGNIPDAAQPLRSGDWLMLLKESYVNAGYTQAQADALAATYGNGTVDTDWENLVTRSGAQKQYNISAQGGDGKTNFYISGGYFKQEAATIGADLTRVSSLIKLEHNVSKKLNFSLNIQPTFTKQNTPLANSAYWANPVTAMFFLRPTQNPFNADGTYNINTSVFGGPYNVLQTTANDVKKLGTVQAISGGQVKYSILNNLDFTSKIGLQYNLLEEYRYDNPYHGDGLGSNGRGFAYNTRYFLYDWVNQLDYRFSLTKDNSITGDARLGYEAISSKGYLVSAAAQNFPNLHEALPYSAVAATVTDGRANISDYSFSSVFANANLSYRGKYIVAANFRRDGSSRFSQNNLYGTFPSASIAWNISKENFMSDIDFISDVKLRASYGSSGNAEIGNYTWRELVSYGATTNYNGQPGGTFSSLGNSNLTWEKNRQTDIGLEASFLRRKLSIVVDYYKKVSDGLLFEVPLSRTSGFSNITQNLGKMQNEGIEFTLNATPVTVGDFNWDINFNFTHNKNKLLTLPEGQTQIINGQFLIKPGYDIYTFYMREWAGVDPQTGSPLWFTDDTRKTTTTSYNAAARVNTGKSSLPKVYGGLSNTFSYKGLSLSADLYYNYGNYVQDTWVNYLYDQTNPAYGKYNINLDRWQKTGDVTNVPKLVYNSANQSNSVSTRFLYKGDFLRLRNVSVGYNFSSALVRKLHLTSLNIYARATNIWTKTYDKNITIDPEQGIGGQSNLNLIYNKAITGGINVGF